MGSASLKLGASFFVSVAILVLVGSWVLYTYESPAEIERCEKAEGAFDSAAILGVDLTEELQEQTSNFDCVRFFLPFYKHFSATIIKVFLTNFYIF